MNVKDRKETAVKPRSRCKAKDGKGISDIRKRAARPR